jgi:hypothetical protein
MGYYDSAPPDWLQELRDRADAGAITPDARRLLSYHDEYVEGIRGMIRGVRDCPETMCVRCRDVLDRALVWMPTK